MSLSTLVTSLTSFHCKGVCNHESCLLSVLRAVRNGILYGAKVRAPHALVMNFLFGSGSLKQRATAIGQATYTHARNLGTFAGLFKLLLCLIRHVRQAESGSNHLVAGFLAGWVCWGEQSAINSQVNMYIWSRITFGCVRTLRDRGYLHEFPNAYALFAATSWALVMYLFAYERRTLQNSLVRSMTYLYEDSNVWPTNAKNIIDWLYRFN